ncbi:MAG: hypothetical protein M0R39_07580 [Prolixibacteraceae bacterium]|nr:hypothetical protein [Prolixibacteraceae bacterium]
MLSVLILVVALETQPKRKFRACIKRPAGKRHNVLQVVEAKGEKRREAQVSRSFRRKPKSQDGGSTLKAGSSQDGMAGRTGSNSLREGIRKDSEWRAGNYNCNRL